MQIIFLKTFSRDIDKLNDKKISKKLLELIFEIKKKKNIKEINKLIKLKGYKNAYRIRIGGYRIGIFINGEIIEFVRFLNRKDIYKYFPK